jgi:hypothetical protein
LDVSAADIAAFGDGLATIGSVEVRRKDGLDTFSEADA